MKVNANRFLETLEELSQFGSTGDGGVSRVCLSPEEVEARKYIADLMKGAGLEAYFDRVANAIGVLNNGSAREPVVSGSHTDSVMNGGRLDGSYGVLAAVEALRTIKESDLKLSRPLVAISFTNEEGVRFPPMIGSKYRAGLMEAEEAYSLRDLEGVKFRDALSASHLVLNNVDPIKRGKGSINSFIETHIEQGPILEREHITIGVVKSIVGILQLDLLVEGSADHAGTTPMSMRRDALVAASKMVLNVNKLAEELGHGAVGTVGVLQNWPNAPNIVPSKVKLTIDFRSNSEQVLQSAEQKVQNLANDISAQASVKLTVIPRTRLQPTEMAGRVVNAIGASTKELGLRYKGIQSGGGHDSMIMHHITDTGMIFVPSKDGKSHSPLEATDPNDLVNGANVLVNTLARLAA